MGVESPIREQTREAVAGHRKWPWLALALAALGVWALARPHPGAPFIHFDDDGQPTLSPERRAKLDSTLRKLDNAEQYALVASRTGWFPCFSCVESDSVFLLTGQVCKYGVTMNGEPGRYGNRLRSMDLVYLTQFSGNLLECEREEKKRIIGYPLLPENLDRPRPLIRPPGNKQDR